MYIKSGHRRSISMFEIMGFPHEREARDRTQVCGYVLQKSIRAAVILNEATIAIFD
jgi:hypothetical protein